MPSFTSPQTLEMKKSIIILRYTLAVVIILIGGMGFIDELMNGYDPNSKDILLFSSQFRALHNAIMLSYLGLTVRGLLVICGALMITKKYWYLGLITLMPIAVNILAMHVLYDIAPANMMFFSLGIFVSLATLTLFIYEWKRFKASVIID